MRRYRESKLIGKELAETALGLGALKISTEKPFVWASGYSMPLYNDNRLLLSEYRYRRMVAEGFMSLIKEETIPCDVVAGTATAGIPHAATLADSLKLPLTYVRDKPKGHGMKNRIEGLAQGEGYEGRRVVLIEDLVSTGGSSIEAIKAVRDAGGQVDSCLAIFSYGFPETDKAFQSLEPPCRIVSLLTLAGFLSRAEALGLLDKKDKTSLLDWQADPFGWGEKRGYARIQK